MKVARWVTWEEPDRDIAVAHWTERDIHVVAPLQWARSRSIMALIQRAKDRVAEIEKTSGRQLVPGSVLLAFSAHQPQSSEQRIDPGVSRRLM